MSKKKDERLELLDKAISLYKNPHTENGDDTVKKSTAGVLPLNKYESKISGEEKDTLSLMSEGIIDSIIEKSGSFSFDMNADPVYKYYSDYYKNEGRKNAEDIMGIASSLTGGYGNSYGMNLAGKALSDASQKTAELGMALEEKAYDRRSDEVDGLYKLLGAVGEMDDRSSSKRKEEYDLAFSAAEKGDYSLLKNLGIDTAALEAGDKTELAKLYAQYGDYSGLSELGIDTSALEAGDKTELAKLYAQYGDYSLLEKLGIDTSSFSEKTAKDDAEFYAKYGDLSLLEALGVDTSSLADENERENAEFRAKYGDYSFLEKMGIDTSGLSEEEAREKAEFFAKYGDYSGLSELGIDITKLTEQDMRSLAELFAKYGDYSLLNALGADTENQEEEDYYNRLILKGRYWNL